VCGGAGEGCSGAYSWPERRWVTCVIVTCRQEELGYRQAWELGDGGGGGLVLGGGVSVKGKRVHQTGSGRGSAVHMLKITLRA